MVLLWVQRKRTDFTMVLLRVQRKTIILRWFCLGSNEKNNGFTLVLLCVLRNNNGFTKVLLRVQRKNMVLHWFGLGCNEKAMVLCSQTKTNNGFTFVLLKVNKKHRFYNGFAYCIKTRYWFFQWFCLGAHEKV